MNGDAVIEHWQCARRFLVIAITLLLSISVWSMGQSSAAEAPTANPRTVEARPSDLPLSASGSPASADIDKLVAESLGRHMKDKEVVEVDLAMKAADLLIGWVKIFGWFVVVPGAMLLTVLSWLGISTFKDVREKSDQVNTILTEVRRTAVQADTALKEAKALLTEASDGSSKVVSQLKRLQVVVTQSEQRIEALDNTVKDILEFSPDAKLSDIARNKISRSLDEFRQYFEQLGYEPSELEESRIKVRTDDPDKYLQQGIITFYDHASSTMFINPNYSESDYPALRQYAHRVLYALRTPPSLSTPQSVVYKWKGLEYGLADYFSASFRNQSKLKAIAMAGSGLQDLIVDLNNTASFQTETNAQFGEPERVAQQAWGGALWEIRSKIGIKTTDMCVYRAWCDLKPEYVAEVDRDFVGNLLTHARKSAPENGGHVIREVLLRRGFNSEFLG